MSVKFKSLLLIVIVLLSCGCREQDKNYSNRMAVLDEYRRLIKSEQLDQILLLLNLKKENVLLIGKYKFKDMDKFLEIRIKNISKNPVCLFPLKLRNYSSVYKNTNELWVDYALNMDSKNIVEPLVLLEGEEVVENFSISRNIPDGVNFRVTFMVPQYSEISKKRLEYKNLKSLKTFKVIANK